MSNEELPAWTARPPEPTRQALEYWNERVRLVEELRQWESPAAEPPDGDVLAWKTRRDEIARLRQELHALDYPDPAAQAEHATDAQAEPDPARRLRALRDLGGSVEWFNSEWKIKRIGELERNEKAERRPRSDQKTIRGDLIKAAKDERAETKARQPPALWHP